MHYKKISADDMRDLIRLQRAGVLFWQDSETTGARAISTRLAPKMPIRDSRRDLSEAQLREWAQAGELFERLDYEHETNS